MDIRTKRVYETPAKADGLRILVDRVWPRGVKKEQAAVQHWMKSLAPSSDLRKWFGHDPNRWSEFQERYRRELDKTPDAVAEICRAAGEGTITLIYSARDDVHNNAVALREYLLKRCAHHRSTAGNDAGH
ncbi:DUF488 domain-containing protein [Thiohalomonas denitrificans]|uniref:Uncharacterized conserved protein YeaO, DUF488 family n=1 Tax=Thiohalomonas denitrificans TaxID=415747 RepID=A0A1G5PYM2_9GAMM|nr:DUF488 domain-containing protein [Thiohalomonas denitrificans]SCZ54488.1 Uncharacterized conserved protein YeaO, DUF488 family [Thiohalomonas denitrificans]